MNFYWATTAILQLKWAMHLSGENVRADSPTLIDGTGLGQDVWFCGINGGMRFLKMFILLTGPDQAKSPVSSPVANEPGAAKSHLGIRSPMNMVKPTMKMFLPEPMSVYWKKETPVPTATLYVKHNTPPENRIEDTRMTAKPKRRVAINQSKQKGREGPMTATVHYNNQVEQPPIF